MRLWLAGRLDNQSSRLPRILTTVLVAVSILAMPIPYAGVRSCNLPYQPLKHLPQKHPVKTRTVLTASMRSSSTSGLDMRSRAAKRFSTLSADTFAAGDSSAYMGLPRVFRPLRC